MDRKERLQPPLFEPSEAGLWRDPDVSAGMLRAHLDPTTDAASRRPETIDAEVGWIVSALDLNPGDPVLDLGCGPGLYCTRLAERALDVTGVDYSPMSIAYATGTAKEQGLSIKYRVQDYLTLADRDAFRAVLLIYGDFCVLSDEQRDTLLERIHRALWPGGFFVFDVMTPAALALEQPGTSREVKQGGFWRAAPHVVLDERFVYPDDHASLHQYSVLDEGGRLTVYRVWSRYYSRDTVTGLLSHHGFEVQTMTSDLTGAPYSADSQWLGVVARRI